MMNQNDRKNDKPWLLMMTYHPQSNNIYHFQTYSIMFAETMCVAKALDYNLGFIDVNKDESLKEMFTYWYSGGYGLGVPYYVVVPGDGYFYHLQQKMYDSKTMIAAVKNITSELPDEFPGEYGKEGNRIWYKEPMRAPRNSINIYLEYIMADAKGIGNWFAKQVEWLHCKPDW